jgi:hypothetical protein
MMDLACDASAPVTLPVADSFYENRLEFPGDCDWVKVGLEAGRHYHLYYGLDKEHEPPYPTLTFGLRAPDGSLLREITQIYSTMLLGFAFTAPQTGTYHVTIAGGGAAGYRLAAGRDCAEAKPTRCALREAGRALAGKLQSYYDVDVIRVFLDQGSTYTFDVVSDTAETPYFVTLNGRRKTLVAGEDVPPPEGSASAKRIGPFRPPATGAYFLELRDSGVPLGRPAEYRVTYRVK